MGNLTTHVVDIAQGCPAAGVAIEVWQVGAAGDWHVCLRRVRTNEDGRTDEPLLSGNELSAGTYQLVFAVGEYFAAQPVETAQPAFLDRVPVRVTVADPTAHYHVPLLVSPWAYSTYRGS